MSKALPLKSAISSTNFCGSSDASFSRRLVCTQRIGSFIHQPCWAEAVKARLSRNETSTLYISIRQPQINADEPDRFFCFQSVFIGVYLWVILDEDLGDRLAAIGDRNRPGAGKQDL